MSLFDHVLPADAFAVGEARRHVRAQLAKDLPSQTVADIELLTSELVSNAVRHATYDGNGIGLNIVVGPQTVHVSVVDGGDGFDRTKLVRGPRPDKGGWGLFLVEELSDRWGMQDDPHSVWFEIDLAE